MNDVLTLSRLSIGYRRGDVVIDNLNLRLPEGRALGVVGMNGAGKSTLLKAIAGQLRSDRGTCQLHGEDVSRLSVVDRTKRGVVLLPEGHQVIKSLTVEQNLLLATGAIRSGKARSVLDAKASEIYDLFPILAERSRQLAGLLSGGEQQMLSLGRALVMRPRLLLLDEPSLGLSPAMVDRIYAAISLLNERGMSMIVVEQNDLRLRSLCSSLIVLNSGQAVLEGEYADLTAEQVRASYFGESITPKMKGFKANESEYI